MIIKAISCLVTISLCLIVTCCFSQICDTTDIARNKPVNVSSSTEWHTGGDAVDGNDLSTWQSGSATSDIAYLKVDLQNSFSICKVKIDWFNDGKAKNYTIDVSSNDSSWTTIQTVTDNSSNTNILTVSGTARYVRISMTLRYYNWAKYEIKSLVINNAIPSNSYPTTSITSPLNSTTFSAGTNLTITANATDGDGNISKVEFFQGTTKIGEDMSSPYSMDWPNLQAGTYSLTVKAYDDINAITTSSAISITVIAASNWSMTGNSGTANGFLGTTNAQRLIFKSNNVEQMTILENGMVVIGQSSYPLTDADAKLAVKGTVYAKKLRVTQLNWADYVFDKDYKLMSLNKVENYIKKHKHLPGIISAEEVKNNGIDVGQSQAKLLEKIEELTLYLIEMNKKLETQQREIDKLKGKR